MQKILLLITFQLASLFGFSQTFTGYGGKIKDDRSKNFYKQIVSGITSTMNPTFGLMGVNINIKHNYDADLDVFLIAPDNTVIELTTGNGGSGKNYDNCLFNNNSGTKISAGKAPFSSVYKPEGSLGILNNGSMNPNGNWQLLIVDTKQNKDTGSLVNWSLIFSNSPSKIESFIKSNLPLMLINTHGKTIMDEPKIWAEMRIISNSNNVNAVSDSAKFFKYGITIEGRGSSSQSFPKKPYGFSTVMKNQADTNVSLLGLPQENDWVLNATYNDKSLMRDVLAYEMARRTGRYATRYRYCELFINGNYEGIYLLMEKIKQDKNRVDISKLEPKDSTGNALTGGYILKIDKTTGSNHGGFTSNGVYFQYDDPNGEDMVKQQLNYIQSFIGKFETALQSSGFQHPSTGWRQYADPSTFIDLSIINEISKNVDGYRLSTYLFKDRDSKGGKLKMGPVWDFNLAWNNADYNQSSDPKGWEIDLSGGAPFWWKKFRQDTTYVKDYYCRWNQLRQSTLSLYSINKFIDSTYKVLEEASYRNFARWPVFGIYIWPNPQPLSYSMKEEVDSLKSWIRYRCDWMDSELAMDCKKVNTCKPRVAVFAEKTSVCKNQSVKLFADGVGISYKWSPSTGLNVTTGREVITTPATNITYKVVMQTKAGCKDSTYVSIKALPLPSKTITGNTSFCEGQSTTLTVSSGAKTYQWVPATGLDNEFASKVKASPAYNINYKVLITDSSGCKDSNFVLVKVNKKPILTITANRDSVCSNDSTILKAYGAFTYKWLKAFGLKDSTLKSVIVYPKNTTYTVIGTSDQGCLDTASFSVYNFPSASIGIDASLAELCYGAGTWLTAKNASNYMWAKTADFNGSNKVMINVFPKVNTTYKLAGQNKHGCNDSANITITVLPEVNFSITGNKVICKGDQTTLNTAGSYFYQWSPNTGLTIISPSQVSISPNKTTLYRVIATDSKLCADTAEIEIKVNELPVLNITTSADTIEQGKSATIKVTGAKDYVWTPNTWLQILPDSVVASPP
ncbi:MAG: CotH kinase family protein, partial [Bacteroidia bacterium]